MAKGEAARRHVDWGIDSFLLDRANTKSAQDMQEIDRRESAIKSVSPSARLLKMQDRLSRSQLASRPWWVVHPLDQAWTQYWDLLVMGALVTVLFLTPYEVAFVDALDLSDPSLCVLFAFNRVIDAIFCLDMALSFHLAYPLEDGRQWVVKPVEIRRNYLRSWFGLDALSIFPCWVVPLLAARDEHGGQALDFLPVVRIIRLFRLIKLARVLGASRLFKRYWDAAPEGVLPSGGDLDIKERMKLLPRVDNMKSLGLGWVSSYNGKPALITKSGSIYKGDDYMEICMNTMRFAYLTKKGVHSLLGRIPDFQLHAAITIEGREDEELPEQVVAAVRITGLDLLKLAFELEEE